MRSKIFIIIASLLALIGVTVLRPVPMVKEDKALSVKGVIVDIHKDGVNDIVFRLKDESRSFYINRGLERGLELDYLKEKLLGHEVVFKYPRHWTLLNWNNQLCHISKVEFNQEILFNELK